MEIYGYIYYTELSDGKYYIGQHKCKIPGIQDPRYFGSGVNVIKYTKNNNISNNVKCEILEWAYSAEELNKLEELYVTKELLNDPLCLNKKTGGNQNVCFSNEVKNIISENSKKIWQNDNHRKIISERISKLSWFNNGKVSIRVLIKPDSEEWKPGRLKNIYNDEYCKKMSNINKNLQWYNNGKECIFTRNPPDGYVLGRINVNYDNNSRFIMSEKGKGRKWYNNGEINIKIKGDPPEGFVKGILMSDKTKKNISNNRKNMVYYNNGIKNIRIKEGSKIPEGFIRGRIKK